MPYDSWENFDSKLEMPGDFTIVPVDMLAEKAKSVIAKMCPTSA